MNSKYHGVNPRAIRSALTFETAERAADVSGVAQQSEVCFLLLEIPAGA